MAPKPWTPGAPPALEHLGTHQALYNPADLGAQAEVTFRQPCPQVAAYCVYIFHRARFRLIYGVILINPLP